MSSKDRGDQSVAMILARLLESGYKVLLPFGDNGRYDLVVDRSGDFERLQCKTGSIRNGCLHFNTASITTYGGKRIKKYYTRNEIDYFAVYSPDLQETFIVPVEDAYGTLRLDVPKNNQTSGIKWAEDFKFDMFYKPG